ncbi:thioesterase II family protein [Sphingobacterium lactis]|uniref:thioesterase II family protein n=1 Tax=Sphingobacterium TaxID=28453 RepID=UPI0021A76561|nr:alpha/beta fold hydrolase [Sphingobacterium hotanense]MCT1525799.1 alpha/beta fold hydrolase [Sphingobacterium hotanense]
MDKRKQIFFLHHAGGSSYSYQFLKPYLCDFNCLTLELPGRGYRWESDFLTDFDAATFDLYKLILENLQTTEIILYGHSMGAYMALRLANLLEKKRILPIHLIVTGSAGPKTKLNKKRYLFSENDLKKEIKAMGGVQDDILQNREFMDYYLPILRADFELIEKSDMACEPPTSTPIFAMMGNEEEHHEKILQWKAYTKAEFGFEILEGGHFFIYKHAEYIASKIKQLCSSI